METRSLAGLPHAEQRALILAQLEAANGNRTLAAPAFGINRRSLVRVIQRIADAEAAAPPVCVPCGLPCPKRAHTCKRCGTPLGVRPETIREEIDRRWGSLGGEQSHRQSRKAAPRVPSKILHCSGCGGARHYANNPECPMYGKTKGEARA